MAQGMVVPYAAFGAVDMSVMLLSADFIDHKIAPVFEVSQLHAAAWGNTWGIVWGLVALNSVPASMSFNTAGMTEAQLQGAGCHLARFFGTMVGLVVGCIVGMMPLAWEYYGFIRLWEASSAAKYGEKLSGAGVDVGGFAASLLAYLKSNPAARGKFANMTQESFKALVQQACPQHAGRADVIFTAMDMENNGFISFEDFFRALVSGPVMNDPRFAAVKWTASSFGIAQPMVDEDHQKLFALINSVVGCMKKADVAGVGVAIRGLRSYTDFHFNRELELLEKCTTYPAEEMAKHKVQHKAFVDKIVEFEDKFADQSLPAVCELVSGDMVTFLTDWLVKHIQNTDRRCTPYYKAHGFSGGAAMTI